MPAAVDEIDGDAAMHVLVHAVGDRHAAGRRERFQPRRDVDAVAVEVVALDHHVAEIDADAQHHPQRFRQGLVGDRHRVLHLGGAFDGVDGAAELHQQRVADFLEDTAAMAGDERLEHVLPPRLQRRKRARLVELHEPAVADDVGRQDRRQTTLNGFFGHWGIKCAFQATFVKF